MFYVTIRFMHVTMLITKYTAILLESARNAESRNATRPVRGIVDADWSSSLESAPRRRRQWRRRHVVHRFDFFLHMALIKTAN